MAFWNRKKAQPEPPQPRTFAGRNVNAAFDSAQTTDNNAAHWSFADALSADSAANPNVRKTLMRRTRYEVANNCYARGIVSTLVNDCVGTGPTLQATTDDEATNDLIEELIGDWAKEIDLGGILRTLCATPIESGEGLLVLQPNPSLKSPIKLTFVNVECDRLTAPYLGYTPDSDKTCDGIDYDDYKNPTTYNILKYHPGNTYGFTANPTDFTPVPARFVFHLFKRLRPEQRRGYPELTPALPLFSQFRRYTLATVGAAESIADVAVAITSKTPAGGWAGDGSQPAMGFVPGERVQLDRGSAMFMPPDTDIKQPEPTQPTSTYEAFANMLIREIARCLDMPFGIAAMDDSKANMSAAYLTRQGYAHAQGIRRAGMAAAVDWMVAIAFDYLSRLPQYDGLQDVDFAHNHNWLWPSLGHHADPAKTANAQKTQLNFGLTDLPTEHAKSGREISKSLANQAKALGISVGELQKLLINQIYPPPAGMQVNPEVPQGTSGGTAKPEKEDEEVAADDD